MTIDKDYLLDALLRYNYLPTQRKASEELPPIFTTSRLKADVASELAKINPHRPNHPGFDQIEYRLTRFNYVSRPLSIPHPLPHSKLSLCIRDCWEHLDYIQTNNFSGIKPQRYPDGRLIVMDYGDNLEKSRLARNQEFGMRFRVHSDISNFFPSIYSHAVPWALVGFGEAKEKRFPRNAGEWFNQLDKNLRFCKRDETQGIAIGPATSNIMAEIILARIDEQLASKGYIFQRFIDDYTCYCETEEKAQEFIRELLNELSKFKLILNIKKTEIIKLPKPLGNDWIINLKSVIPSEKSINSHQAIHFLEYALSLANKHPEGSVMKFALKTLSKKQLDLSAKLDVLGYGLGLAFHQSFLLPLLDKLLDDTWLIARFDVPKKLNVVVREHSKFHRSDGMTWGLYLLAKNNTEIEESTANAVIATGDVMSIAVLYWSGQHQDKVKKFAEKIIATNDLYEFDACWLLLYELFRNGVVKNPYQDDVFEILKNNNVYFLADEDTIAADRAADDFSQVFSPVT